MRVPRNPYAQPRDYKHNMLSLLYATCLKLLVFIFFVSLGERNSSDEIYDQMLAGKSQSRVTTCDSVLPHTSPVGKKKFSVI